MHNIELNREKTERVKSFICLGTIMEENGKLDKEMDKRMGKVGSIHTAMTNTFLDKKEISKDAKIGAIKKVLYEVSSWQ